MVEISGSAVSLPSKLAAIAVLNQAAAVQNTWYDVLPTTSNVVLYWLSMQMDTLAEDIQMRITIDGQVYTATQNAAVAGTQYWVYLTNNIGAVTALPSTSRVLSAFYATIEGRSVRIEVRKTSAGGANNLKGSVIFGKW